MTTRSRRSPIVLASSFVAGALAVAAAAWWVREPRTAPAVAPVPPVSAEPAGARAEPETEPVAYLPRVRASRRGSLAAPGADAHAVEQPAKRAAEDLPRDARFWRENADIEDFKRAVYALEIDRIEDIPKLEALVHVEVEDPRELWDTDWAGVDDWKRYQDGFSLERGPDDTLLFHPGAETQRMFTFFEGISLYEWDESNGAFVNQVDYYGKPIYNVVKFLREDVLVMMTISGHKVDTNLFQQGDYR